MAGRALNASAVDVRSTAITKANELFAPVAEGRTETFRAVRNEMNRAWSAETAGRVTERIAESRDGFVQAGGTVEAHDGLLGQILDQPETQVLAALYSEASYREAIAERRRMLSFAAASIVALDLAIEEKASVERVLRNLEPDDVLELHKLSRAVGTIERLPDGFGKAHPSTDALRHALLSRSSRNDALVGERCVRETQVATGGGFGSAPDSYEIARVTDRGLLILRVLARYIHEKHDALVGCGREEISGSRSPVEARRILNEAPGFVAALRAALAAAAVEEIYPGDRPSFSRAAPTLVPSEDGTRIVEPSPRAASKLSLWAAPPDAAHRVPQPPTALETVVTLEDLSGFGRPATNVLVTGPYDLLRWLAEDLDAHWT
jgi:hypothetical protein